MPPRLRLLALSLVLLVGACGAPKAIPSPSAAPSSAAKASAPPAPGYWIYAHDGGGSSSQRLRIVDSGTGSVERELPLGIPARDWSKLFAIEPAGGTTLRILDLPTGKLLRDMPLEGGYWPPGGPLGTLPLGLSPDGHWLVLTSSTSDGQRGISNTRYLVIDTTFATPPHRIQLDGWFTFDAISNDGLHLYLNEYLGHWPQTPRHRLRVYDLSRGQLSPDVLFDQSEGKQGMTGDWHSQVISPDGRFLYSLFVSYSGYADEDQTPLVHAIDLNNGSAFSIGLPWNSRAHLEGQSLWLLALRPDTNTLYAVNGALGLVAEIDASERRVQRTASLQRPPRGLAYRLFPEAEAKMMYTGGAVLSPDGDTLFAPALKGLVAIDTRKLSLRAYLREREFDSFAISPEGAWLYAISARDRKLLQIDPRTLRVSAEVAGFQGPVGLYRVEARR